MTPPDFDAMAREWLRTEAESAPYHGQRGRLSALLRSVHAAGREAGSQPLEREIAGYLDRLQAAHRMLADCAEHIDMVCMCGHEDAGGETITPDRCWWHRIQAAIRGEYVPHRETP